MKTYFEIEIGFNESNYELIYNELYLNGITSIYEDSGAIKASLPEEQLDVLESIKTNLINNNIVKHHSIYISQFGDLDWNKQWEKTIEPVHIRDRIIIFPSWKKDQLADTEGKVLIEIDPKMSFGTGHNETTQLMLEMMCVHIESSDKYMLDFGCGTAILAIAAVKLGVNNAVAIDTDEDSIENAKEYIINNNVFESINLHCTDLNEISETGFDVIAANITSGVIIPKLSLIYQKLKSAGKLFITGILTEESEEINSELLKNNFRIQEIYRKAEWSGFYCRKN